MKNLYKYYLFFIVVITLSTKWFFSISEFGLNLNSLLLFNLEDTQYFPIVYALSDFNISPTYLYDVKADKIIGFPLVGIIAHALLYKVIGIYSFIFLEFFFQIVFLFILFKLFTKVFNDKKKSFYFIFFLIFFTVALYHFQDYIILKNLYFLFESNLGTRFPRPLITGIIIFLMFYYLLDFQNQLLKNFDNIYLVKIAIILSLLLNTFFYYFIIFSVLLIVTTVHNLKKKLFSIIILKKTILFLITFLFCAIPFILQQIYAEPDYSNRIGLIQIDSDKKYFLIIYFLKKILNLKFILIFIITFILFYCLKDNKKYEKLNIFFYFCLSSILSTIIFIIFSPGIISIYHLADILIFTLIFYLLISFFSIIYNLMTKSKFLYNFIDEKKIYLPILIFLILHTFLEQNEFEKKKNLIEESLKIEKFLDDNKLYNTKYKLFSNDGIASNIWLLNKNHNLLVSDGFTNSQKNSQIEYNIVNSLKHFGFSEENFKDFISYEKSEIRHQFFLRLFIYRYQANSLFTYSDLKDYHVDLQKIIINTSPFRVQNQILPKDEKRRLLNLFSKHKINTNFTADYVIINQSTFSEDFQIFNKEYKEVFKSKNYKIYSR